MTCKYCSFVHNNVIQAQHITIFALLNFLRFFFVFGVTLTGCQCFPMIISILPLGVIGVDAGRRDASVRKLVMIRLSKYSIRFRLIESN